MELKNINHFVMSLSFFIVSENSFSFPFGACEGALDEVEKNAGRDVNTIFLGRFGDANLDGGPEGLVTPDGPFPELNLDFDLKNQIFN